MLAPKAQSLESVSIIQKQRYSVDIRGGRRVRPPPPKSAKCCMGKLFIRPIVLTNVRIIGAPSMSWLIK